MGSHTSIPELRAVRTLVIIVQCPAQCDPAKQHCVQPFVGALLVVVRVLVRFADALGKVQPMPVQRPFVASGQLQQKILGANARTCGWLSTMKQQELICTGVGSAQFWPRASCQNAGQGPVLLHLAADTASLLDVLPPQLQVLVPADLNHLESRDLRSGTGLPCAIPSDRAFPGRVHELLHGPTDGGGHRDELGGLQGWLRRPPRRACDPRRRRRLRGRDRQDRRLRRRPRCRGRRDWRPCLGGPRCAEHGHGLAGGVDHLDVRSRQPDAKPVPD
mmetsp:Transcript_57662/g.113496  ORF Transcript_57662/g.113496 Transcript_57662/m.113496 type:complete len:275 (+) Transcript_57662:500-1324(+)